MAQRLVNQGPIPRFKWNEEPSPGSYNKKVLCVQPRLTMFAICETCVPLHFDWPCDKLFYQHNTKEEIERIKRKNADKENGQ